MSYFSKYRKFYLEPERVSPEIARLNRINAELQKNIELQQRFNRLSPVTKSILDESSRIDNDRLRGGHKAASIAAALSQFKERDFADPQLRASYRELRARQGGQQNVKPAGSDRRQYHPDRESLASTVYGTIARLTNVTHALPSGRWLPAFSVAHAVVPCIQRATRREVMFAKKKAGRGYKVKHRRNWASGVPC